MPFEVKEQKREAAWQTEAITARRKERITMPPGDKSGYTDKQKRQAAHIEAGYEKRVSAPRTPRPGLGSP